MVMREGLSDKIEREELEVQVELFQRVIREIYNRYA
jgi:hypothetical protein